jgi:hypothetical protein
VYGGASIEIGKQWLLPFVLRGYDADALASLLFQVAREASKFGSEERFGGKSLKSGGLMQYGVRTSERSDMVMGPVGQRLSEEKEACNCRDDQAKALGYDKSHGWDSNKEKREVKPAGPRLPFSHGG